MLVPVPSEATGATASSEFGAANEACAEGGYLIGHSMPYLTGFTVVNPATPFYAVEEGGSSAGPVIRVTSADLCSGEYLSGRGDYVTANGSATAGTDYTSVSGTTNWLCVNFHPDLVSCDPPTNQQQQAIPVPITSDSDDEDAVESFRFRITSGTPFGLPTHLPTQAPVHVIDDDGPARVSLEPTLDGSATVAYASGEPSIVDIPVFWAGSGTPGGVHYTVSAGSPAPTPDVDYRILSENPLPQQAFSLAGGRLAFIRIRILNNAGADGKPAKELNEIITVSLDDDPAYDLEPGRGSTTLTILDGGFDTRAPRTRFHHPRHKKKYARNAYQLREMHVFYNRSEEVYGSGIKRVHLAISRKKKNGKCQWWNGNRFRPGRCNPVPGKFWKRTKYDRFLDWFLYRVPGFKPTQGTNLRFYRAYSRGFDHAGNVESRFIKKRNKNTFWIKRR